MENRGQEIVIREPLPPQRLRGRHLRDNRDRKFEFRDVSTVGEDREKYDIEKFIQELAKPGLQIYCPNCLYDVRRVFIQFLEQLLNWSTAYAQALGPLVKKGVKSSFLFSSSLNFLTAGGNASSDECGLAPHGSSDLKIGGGSARESIEDMRTRKSDAKDGIRKSILEDEASASEDLEAGNLDPESGAETSISSLLYPPGSSFGDVGEDELELNLDALRKLPDSHDFFCPNCNACITRVVIRRTRRSESMPMTLAESSPQEEGEKFSCRSCFSFLISRERQKSQAKQEPDIRLPHESEAAIPELNLFTPIERMETPKWSSGAKRWDRTLKCIVFGGLTESITSLGIVTSAATANISNGSIVVLAVTNLITGLFVIRHHLAGFKKGSNGTADEQVKQLKEVLQDRLQFLLHFTIAILSFLFFGLVPPLVYAFSFRENIEDKDLKLAAAAGASLFCTAFLAIEKARIQNAENWLVYVKTAASHVLIGVGSFGLSYFAGDLFKRLTEKLD